MYLENKPALPSRFPLMGGDFAHLDPRGFNILTICILTFYLLHPYTDERRDVLENTPPEAQEISRRRGFCTPRPERLPEGEARGQSRGQSRGPRGAKSPPEGNLLGLGGCIFQCIPTRGSVRTFFHHYQGSIDFLV